VIDTPTQERVKALLREFMQAWIAKQYEELRRIDAEGFSPGGVLAPFHDALVPGTVALESAVSRRRLAICMSALRS
jgi:hypothetical protein